MAFWLSWDWPVGSVIFFCDIIIWIMGGSAAGGNKYRYPLLVGFWEREDSVNYLSLPRSLVGFDVGGGHRNLFNLFFFYSCLKFKEGRILRTTSPFPIIRQEIPGGGEGWGVFHKCFLIRVWNFKEGRILRTTSPFPIIRQEIPEGCEGWGVFHNCTPWQVQQLILFF